MEQTASVVLRWAGRILILAAVFILAASLFLPDAVAPLNPLVCPDGTELDNTRYTAPNAPPNEDLELVCTSKAYTESAAQKVLLLAGGLGVAGIVAIWASGRVTHKRTQAPSVPTSR